MGCSLVACLTQFLQLVHLSYIILFKATLTGELSQTCVQGASTHTTAQTQVCMIYSYAKLFEKGHLVINLETEKPRVCSTVSIVIQQACSQGPVQHLQFIYSHIAPFFHIYLKFVRTLLLACTNVKFKTFKKFHQICILHISTFYKHYKANQEYSYCTIHVKQKLIQYSREKKVLLQTEPCLSCF